jgi:hypothetical protein
MTAAPGQVQPWICEAYNEGAAEHGALCFVAAELGTRLCPSQTRCKAVMVAERQRIYGRIQELAAAGDTAAIFLAAEFTSPDQLLGGDGERPDLEDVEDLEGIIIPPDPAMRPVGFNCPSCNQRARMMVSPTQAACTNRECPIVLWDITQTVVEVAATERINEIVFHEREAGCGCPRRGANVYHVRGQCTDPAINQIKWNGAADPPGDAD